MSIDSILGPQGTISRKLGNFESRPQQVLMAQAVARAISGPAHLLVEAGTGVGKSFGYLVPAILAAAEDPQCRVVISTHTINLQEQLIGKDLPFLQTVMPQPFTAALVKGRANYLSLRRLKGAREKMHSLLAEPGTQEQLHHIDRWSQHTDDGSRSDLDFNPAPVVWELVESDANNCLGKKCPTYDQCFYFKARGRIQNANLLVVNHALFFSDLALRKEGYGLLPDYQVVIFDEAHTLEDVAADHLGLEVSQGGLEYLCNRLYSVKKDRGLLHYHGDSESSRLVDAVRFAAQEFFADVLQWYSRQDRKTGRVTGPHIVGNPVSEELKKLAAHLTSLTKEIRKQEDKIELIAAARRCLGMSTAIVQWLEQQWEGQVYWVEIGGAYRQRVTLACAPIEVGPSLRELLYEEVSTVIMTSATLNTGGNDGFRLFQNRLGLGNATAATPVLPEHRSVDECLTLQLGSPFNY
ncbi:MAG TPA: ATP-dependent DNA helicase, partial [Gemmataceae bacterium]|nr:ATP-dependent DNA helicase [Gemmataceae bacterium]